MLSLLPLTLASPPAMATSLLLVVHGRTAGVIPPELQSLAVELGQRRGAPVWVQALTSEHPPTLPVDERQLTLVPLMLLPGAHVRQDIPAIARHWSAMAGVDRVRRVPFIGAWPAWQQALAAEVSQLQSTVAIDTSPWLLHHPLEGPLAPRYLHHLARVSGARLHATPYSAEQLAELQLSLTAPAVPLALAANRLTDQLAERVGPPLLQRPRFRQVLLEQLGGLP